MPAPPATAMTIWAGIKLDHIYADLFGTEDALVRVGFVNGTHAISSALFGVLRAGRCAGVRRRRTL